MTTRQAVQVFEAAVQATDARVAALEAAIEAYRQARMQFEAGAAAGPMNVARDRMFAILRGEA